MNFKKIQWIFLAAFALLDIFLASFVLMNTKFISIGKQQNTSQIILKEMKNDSITTGSLSGKTRMGYYLAAAKTDDNGELQSRQGQLKGQTPRVVGSNFTSSFNEPVRVDEAKPQKKLNKLCQNPKWVINGSQYTYNAHLSTSKTVVYTQRMAGEPLFGPAGLLRFRLNGRHEVVGYTQSFLKPGEVLRPRQTAISQKQAVIALYKHNEIPSGSTIQWVDFGYSRLLTNGNHAVYIPTWTASIKAKNTGKKIHCQVNAFTGLVMKNGGQSTSSSSSTENN
ncbi:two-component system regulatory protein YycI [uncultured Limosilactobacillus sp.]|uniref:two-component system regulatory protein YycI n=1 Tax=uncultured Limosilactobacillus sp. TaxID=2837629 RepID=UPI0025DD1EB3|nr:two-component system regulatory protein YycI [uncultured Limosilactobacillus sp.]